MTKPKRWSDLSPLQQGASIALVMIQIGLMAAALVDIRRRSATQIRGSKRAWVAAAFVNYVGPLAYFVFGRRR